MKIKETYVNKDPQDSDKDRIYGETEWYEPFTDDIGMLYRSLLKEYGRCTGKVYQDGQDGKPFQCGWVFLKRAQYQDCNETYLQETWITVAKEAKFHPARWEVSLMVIGR